MTPDGYIKLHRQITENELWHSERFTKAQAWVDLLLLATYKQRTIFIRGIELKLNPGDLCYSQLTLSKRWKWNERTVNKFLTALQNREMIQTRITNVTTIISILKWNEYQFTTEQSTEQNTEQMQTRIQTNKKGKKGNNIKNHFSIENLPINLNGNLFLKTKFFFVTNSLKDELRNNLKENFSVEISDQEMKYEFIMMESWIESHEPKKNYKTFFMNWFKKMTVKNTGKQTEKNVGTL